MRPSTSEIKMIRENPRQVAAEQAEDQGLWFHAETATEAYLQRALRRLTAAVEGEAWKYGPSANSQ